MAGPTLHPIAIGYLLLMLAAAITCPACTTTDRPLEDAEPFSLTLRTTSTDKQYTYFELTRLGELSYGGGQDAVWREATPVLTLTADEIARVRQILRDHRLFHVNKPRKQDDADVRYELKLQRRGLAGRTLRCADDQIPGVRQLHDYLFALQARQRYNVPLPGS